MVDRFPLPPDPFEDDRDEIDEEMESQGEAWSLHPCIHLIEQFRDRYFEVIK
jgi:hypothetical protein